MARQQEPRPAKTVKAYLIYRASDASLRVVKGERKLTLAWDEIAWRVQVEVPDPWGRLVGSILVELPDMGPPLVEVRPEPIRPPA